MSGRIAFQGELGAYSHQACQQARVDMTAVPCVTFEEVIDRTVTGDVDLGMLAVENSTYGRVADVHRLLPQSGLHIVDEISTFVGKTAGWAILILTFVTSYEVFMRYVFGAPTTWAFDASYMLYGALFMLAGAYALSRNSHVRGDFIYRSWPVRRQAGMDLTLCILFFFPGILALIYSGFGFAEMAWVVKERSSASPSGPPVYHFKTLIPVTGALMLLQGIVEFMRCIIAFRDGKWPQRLHDVQELDQQMLQKAEQGEYQTIKDLEELGQRKGAV